MKRTREKVPGIGDKVRDGKFQFVVQKVETGIRSVGRQYFGEKAQGQFVLVHVKVTNIGDEAQTLLDSNQVLTDARGRTFEPDTAAAIYIEDNDVFIEKINPGNSVTGIIVYDMPKGAKPKTVELHDSMFSNGVQVVLTDAG